MKTTSGSVTDYCGNFIYADNQLITIFAGDVRVAPVNFGNSTYWKYEYSISLCRPQLRPTRAVAANELLPIRDDHAAAKLLFPERY